MKYIKAKIDGLIQIIIFPKSIGHDEMARMLKVTPLSAGFVSGQWECYGESVTLKLGAQEEDTDMLLRLRQ